MPHISSYITPGVAPGALYEGRPGPISPSMELPRKLGHVREETAEFDERFLSPLFLVVHIALKCWLFHGRAVIPGWLNFALPSLLLAPPGCCLVLMQLLAAGYHLPWPSRSSPASAPHHLPNNMACHPRYHPCDMRHYMSLPFITMHHVKAIPRSYP